MNKYIFLLVVLLTQFKGYSQQFVSKKNIDSLSAIECKFIAYEFTFNKARYSSYYDTYKQFLLDRQRLYNNRKSILPAMFNSKLSEVDLYYHNKLLELFNQTEKIRFDSLISKRKFEWEESRRLIIKNSSKK